MLEDFPMNSFNRIDWTTNLYVCPQYSGISDHYLSSEEWPEPGRKTSAPWYGTCTGGGTPIIAAPPVGTSGRSSRHSGGTHMTSTRQSARKGTITLSWPPNSMLGF